MFRYALERFDVDPFEFVVFHRGPLAVSEKAAVDALEKLSGDAESTLSLRVRLIDLAAPASSGEKPEGIPPRDAKLPWLVVVTAHGELTSPVWSGSLGEADLRALVDSPVRRVLAKRLLAGDAAVFVLLESGKKEPDGQAAKLLQTTLAGLEKTLRLPSDDDGQEQPPDEKAAAEKSSTDKSSSTDPPAKITFSTLRIARDDPAERYLVKLLLGLCDSEADLTGPIVFPVFGRGRVLTVFSGDSLCETSLQAAGEFLCGSCSCSLKEQLPGRDLLMAADWLSGLEGRAIREEPISLQGLGPLAKAASLAVSPPAKDDPPTTPPTTATASASAESPVKSPAPSSILFWTILAAGACAVLIIAAGSLWLLRKASVRDATRS